MSLYKTHDREFYRKLLKLMLPISLQSLMLALVAAADAFMLGRVEQNSMSAVSLATQIQFIQNFVIYAATSVIAVLGAQYWGKNDIRAVKDILSIALKVSIFASVLFFVGCLFFPRYLMLLFTQEEVLVGIGVRYLKIAGWSYLLTGISQCFLAVMKVSGNASMSAAISSVTVVLNIILNAILIFGFLGLPAMGVQGAAVATLIARIVELLWSVIISHTKGYIHPEYKRFFARLKQLNADFFKLFLPVFGACMFWGIGFTSYSAFMGHLGTDSAAANSVASVIRDLVCALCNGLSSAAGIIVGNELGAGNLSKGKLYGDRLVKLSFAAGFLSTALMLLVLPLSLKFVKLTDQASSYLWGMMLIMAFYMIGRTVNSVLINGIFYCGGDSIFDVYSLAVCMWGIAVPLAAMGTFWLHWPVLVVYACTCVDEVGKIPWVLLHYRKYKWVKDLTRSKDEQSEPSHGDA
ncbi:MAG: MATE family efflux transporter [Treponemataceae bacterium]|nr:MATE family efflux transporter [Treponemataceae bacterium]